MFKHAARRLIAGRASAGGVHVDLKELGRGRRSSDESRPARSLHVHIGDCSQRITGTLAREAFGSLIGIRVPQLVA
eukprot:766425-Hanusia_phi.AAC.7